MRTILLCCLLPAFLAGEAVFPQEAGYQTGDKILFDQYKRYIKPFQSGPPARILEKSAAFFLGTPYASHTLDGGDGETLTINLREMDCFTYVENVIALSQTVLDGEGANFDTFTDNLRKLRYRNGEITGFSSRLHYTCDWAYENEKRGLVKNISQSLGGIKEGKTIDFMSVHRDAYRQLESDDVMLRKIATVEDEINLRGGFFYLPKDKISAEAAAIPNLSMIAFVTSIDGLDVTHVGFVWREKGRTGFIHASSAEKKVTVDAKTLSDYCLSRKSCAGIMVLPLQLR